MQFSRQVISNQTGPHQRLEEIVRRHLNHESKVPVPEHARRVFETVQDLMKEEERPLVLDSGCGTGDSARRLARLWPDHLVLGIDKSVHRLSRERGDEDPGNLHLLRGDLFALYPLLAEAGIKLARHFIFYPNPWPKAAHLQRRWHGSAVFPAIVQLGGLLELRTNWPIYAEEFGTALRIGGIEAEMEKLGKPRPEELVSPFEEKYALSGHDLWRVTASL